MSSNMPARFREAFLTLVDELRDAEHVNTQELINCGGSSANALIEAADILADALRVDSAGMEGVRTSLTEIAKDAHVRMASKRSGGTRGWRRIYTDACILLACADVLDFSSLGDKALALSAVSHLDHAIVIAGAPERLDTVLDMIEGIQSECLEHPVTLRANASFVPSKSTSSSFVSSPLPSASKGVPRFDTPPSLTSFLSRLSGEPFVLPGFLLDWPALNEHPWASLDYLRAIAGPGRVVPIEVGSDYRSDDWTQKMMPWDDFLGSLEEQPSGLAPRQVLYLAQHSLFNQFPALKDDILLPDYVYSDLDPPHNYPQYVPPRNEERLVLNAWLGPVGTISPAHTDPFFNFFGQVVGRKTVWLAPPEASLHMYSYVADSPSCESSPDSSDQPHNPAANNESPSMSNTSRVDVLLSSSAEVTASRANFPCFWEHVVPTAMSVTLEPGDLLFFPPGWWHSLRSEETSFSVSMWF